MKEHPILFSGKMVKAILEERKTMTRRILDKVWQKEGYTLNPNNPPKCPYGEIGDRLWVRETFCEMDTNDGSLKTFYRADGENEHLTWRPSIFMPRALSRITLEITDVRVERLQDIPNKDARAEGVTPIMERYKNPILTGIHGAQRADPEFIENMQTHRYAFVDLWDKINGKRASWESNPWVWVIEFKKV